MASGRSTESKSTETSSVPRSDFDRIGGFVAGLGESRFATDSKSISAVLYEIAVIGEAAKGVSQVTRNHCPSMPWAAMAGMRDGGV